MFEPTEALTRDIQKIGSIISTVSKMDVRFVNNENVPILQLISHSIPAIPQINEQDYQTINDHLRKAGSHSYHYYTNAYGLEFISASVRKNDSYYGAIIVGPFTSRVTSNEFISDVISENNLPVSARRQLQEFYTSLPVVSSSFPSKIGNLIVNMCTNTFIDAQLITSDTIRTVQTKEQLKADIIESKDIIELIYQNEKLLMNAISNGNIEEIEEFIASTNSWDFDDRIPESPIRSTKNLLIVMNTLCRVAVERGGVHPVYIHDISEKFALLIERATSLAYLKKLQSVILKEYCLLVREYSTHQYSAIVKKATVYINLNYEEPLTLEQIAATIPTHPSHLSRKFKQETGMGIVEYIHTKRVEAAKLYLKTSNLSITDIAFMVGFNDVNYFSRVFKKVTALTPSQYMKNI